MARRKFQLKHPELRSILTDILPFEVPPTFSNRGLYRFFTKHKIEIEEDNLTWTADGKHLDAVMCILFGLDRKAVSITEENVTEWGRTRAKKSVKLGRNSRQTIPFNFSISHNRDSRTLSVIHPRNQLAVANFYSSFSALILYYSSLSEFSIRRPVSVARASYFNDRVHENRRSTTGDGVEEEGKEYEQLGSYFVYKKYSNIHRFFESYHYHRCEKKYESMLQMDIRKCFDSIYTHSCSWAILGKDTTKLNLKLKQSHWTLGGRFDALMRHMNHNETNGIVIGPEFSRIFAEIILQAIDVQVINSLAGPNIGLKHKVDYEIFRYVDDYFIFFNREEDKEKIVRSLQSALRKFKLSINTEKIKEYQKPIITELTIAKERISSMLESEIRPTVQAISVDDDPDAPPQIELHCPIKVERTIKKFKTALKETGAEYGSLLNYTLEILQRKLEEMIKKFDESGKREGDKSRLTDALLEFMEFSFFVYAASPRVNHTIRLCRLITTSSDFLNSAAFPHELKHLFFKYVFDNVRQQLEKNVVGNFHEVETLYLITCLTRTGKEYWLPEATLRKYFLIKKRKNGAYVRKGEPLSHFAITVLISYMKTKGRYKGLREFIEAHAIQKLKGMRAFREISAEALMLLLDLCSSPFVSKQTKKKLGGAYGLNQSELAAIQTVNDYWFTAWDERFDLARELDAKRGREVY